jgi:hypothetical protein
MIDKEYYKKHKKRLLSRMHLYYLKNRERLIEYRKQYYQKNRNKCMNATRNWRKNNPEKAKIVYKKQRIKYATKYPERIKATNMANSLIKINTNDKCKLCGCKYHLEKHHADYTKPLRVDILCRKCHKNMHSQEAHRV